MDPWRRRTCLALVVCGVLVAGITIVAAHNPRGYVYQARLAHPFAGLFVALAMITFAAHLFLRARR
jgi:succinate dehydrogenase hydrophobic anchor subunit